LSDVADAGVIDPQNSPAVSLEDFMAIDPGLSLIQTPNGPHVHPGLDGFAPRFIPLEPGIAAVDHNDNTASRAHEQPTARPLRAGIGSHRMRFGPALPLVTCDARLVVAHREPAPVAEGDKAARDRFGDRFESGVECEPAWGLGKS